MDSYIETGEQLESIFNFLIDDPELFVKSLPADSTLTESRSKPLRNKNGEITAVYFTLNQLGAMIVQQLDAYPYYEILGGLFSDRFNYTLNFFARFYDHPDILLRAHLQPIKEYKERNSLASRLLGKNYFVPRMKNTIAEIMVHAESGDFFTGSAFAIKIDKKFKPGIHAFLTCKHNVFERENKKFQSVEVLLDGKSLNIMRVMPFADIDVCVLVCESSNVEVIEIGNSGHLQGESVFAAGFPRTHLLRRSSLIFQDGIICAEYDEGSSSHAIIHSCFTAPGNSGGPLLNAAGSAVGIVHQQSTVKFSDASFSFGEAIPMTAIAKHWPSGVNGG